MSHSTCVDKRINKMKHDVKKIKSVVMLSNSVANRGVCVKYLVKEMGLNESLVDIAYDILAWYKLGDKRIDLIANLLRLAA